MVFRIRGEDGKFVGLSSLRGRTYHLTMSECEGQVVNVEQCGMRKREIAECLAYIAQGFPDLRGRVITITGPNNYSAEAVR